MKEFLLTATYLVGAGELLLAAYFWKTNSGNEIRRAMVAVSAFVGLWVISIGLTVWSFGPSSVIIGATYFFGILLTTSVLWLAVVFPYKIFMFDGIHLGLMYLPSFIFSFFIFNSNTIVREFVIEGFSGRYVEGELFPIFGSFLTIQFLIALILMFVKLRRSDGIHRKMLRISFWSFLIGGAPAVLFTLVLPIFSGYGTNPFLATLSTVIWFGATTYVITRRTS